MVRGYVVGIVSDAGITEISSPTPIKVTQKDDGYFFVSDGVAQEVWVHLPKQIMMKKVVEK